MSYSGTVYCRYCGQKGHNRRTCEQLKEYCKKNPDTWTARSVKQSKESAKIRTCSYCDETGHNRATCSELKKHFKLFNKINHLYRLELTKWAEKNGIAPGALVEVPEVWVGGGVGYLHDVLGVITNIDWEDQWCGETTKKPVCTVALCDSAAGGKETTMPFPAVEKTEYDTQTPWASDWSDSYGGCRLVGPVTVPSFSTPFGETTDLSTKALKKIFKGHSKDSYYGEVPRFFQKALEYWNEVGPTVSGLEYREYNTETAEVMTRG